MSQSKFDRSDSPFGPRSGGRDHANTGQQWVLGVVLTAIVAVVAVGALKPFAKTPVVYQTGEQSKRVRGNARGAATDVKGRIAEAKYAVSVDRQMLHEYDALKNQVFQYEVDAAKLNDEKPRLSAEAVAQRQKTLDAKKKELDGRKGVLEKELVAAHLGNIQNRKELVAKLDQDQQTLDHLKGKSPVLAVNPAKLGAGSQGAQAAMGMAHRVLPRIPTVQSLPTASSALSNPLGALRR